MLQAGVMTHRTDDPSRGFALLQRDGAVILTWPDTDPDAATTATAAVLGNRLRAHRRPVNVAANPTPGKPTYSDAATRTVNSDATMPNPVHIDGYMMYGDSPSAATPTNAYRRRRRTRITSTCSTTGMRSSGT